MSGEDNNCAKINDVFEELCRQLSINGQVADISEKFSLLNSNAERVKFASELLEKYALYPEILHREKDDELSAKYRQEGNNAFKRKEDHTAWRLYTKSISYATNNSECLALAYANRSAVLYEKKLYKQCLEDITNAFKNNYPKRLHGKLIQREERARELQLSETTDRYFERPSGLKEANRKIPSASAKVEIRRTKALGRHIVAKRKIKIGEIVVVEKPFVSVLLKAHLQDHCFACLTLRYSTIPCDRCVYAMFCSRTCQQQAWEQHHKYECPMLATLYGMDVSKMTLAALRIAFVAKKHYYDLDKYNNDNDGGAIYKSQSYEEIHTLEANTHLRNSSDLFPKATTAAVVRYVADRTSPSFVSEFSRDDAAIIFDELLMHHQQTAATNFHEINECAEDEEGRYVNTSEIGAGAYAFLSLFNHSCSPNVVRYCHGTEIIVRAIKEIPADGELLDNYGYHYAVMRKADRKRELQRQYLFNCECEACVNDWPLYKNLPRSSTVDKSYDMPELESIMMGDRAEAIRILTFLLGGHLKTVVCNTMPEPNKLLADFQETIKQCYALLDVGRRKMEKYEQLAVVGEGSYGLVMKCRHRESDQIVAVKKFLETEEDATVRRMALREIRMLKKLRHENLVTMIEVFRYRKRFYLVFEYLEGTVLDELEKMPGGLGDERSRERIYQVTRAINFCHSNHIIHRDVKPENVLVSSMGVVKLCDFGFARLVSVNGEPCTEYVATRWYRAPELLVGEQQYGPSVDIWAIGCLFAEMMTGDPLFPGDSDIDQLYLIVRMIGKPCTRHQQIIAKTNHLKGIIKSAAAESNGLYKTFSNWSLLSLDFLISCMKMDPFNRPTADELLRHNYFTHDRFPQKFLPALREKVLIEFNANPLLRKYKADILMSTDRKDEIRQRRSLQVDPPKWKISLTEGSIKRKFSCDTVSSSSGCDLTFGGDRSPMNATTKVSGNGAHRLINVGQKSGTSSFFIKPPHHHHSSYKSLSKQSTPKISGGQLSGRETELHKLEKSLENLAKLANQKSDSLRPVSAQKDNKKMGSPIVSGSPPPPFQSLQANIPDYSKSPGITQQQQQQQVLHPTINNISFTKAVGVDTSKKSPNLLQNIHSTCIKNTFNQVPLVNPPRGHYLKKLDRNLVLDSMFMNVEPVVVNQQNQLLMAPSWLNGNNNNMAGGSSHHHYLPKRKESKPKADEFTLPNLPGATASPNKTKKKTHPSPEHHQKAIVTPRIVQSSASQKSSASKFIITTSSHSSSFPFM